MPPCLAATALVFLTSWLSFGLAQPLRLHLHPSFWLASSQSIYQTLRLSAIHSLSNNPSCAHCPPIVSRSHRCTRLADLPWRVRYRYSDVRNTMCLTMMQMSLIHIIQNTSRIWPAPGIQPLTFLKMLWSQTFHPQHFIITSRVTREEEERSPILSQFLLKNTVV